MALLTPVQITKAGILVSLASAAAGGDTYDNSNNPHIEILNGGGSGITLYAAIYADGQTIVQGRSWAIGAGERRKIGPLPSSYVNPSDSRVSLTYSSVTSVSIGVFYQ